ncbi:MAG: hypothetical protein WC465_05025 [Patescibacteria group bacterium]
MKTNELSLNTKAQTMSLKEITDLLNVRHDKAMVKISEMINWPDLSLPPINLWSAPCMQKISITDALDSILDKTDTNARGIGADGLYSIHDAVFEATLHNLGVDHEVISWRMLEDVEDRKKVIEFYENT